MDKLCLYFFSEEEYINFPKDFKTLKELISSYFLLSKRSIEEINFCYNNSDATLLSIKNENDYTLFRKKNINNLYLDAGNNYEIYDEFLLNKEKNDENEDVKRLNELTKKDEEFKKLYETKFKNEENEINEINKLLQDLQSRKIEILKHIKRNRQILDKEHQKIKTELTNLKRKLGMK